MARRMPTVPKTEAARQYFEELDERRAMQRFVDQPGQWEDLTPKAVKIRNAKAMKRLMASLAAEQEQKSEKK